MKRICMWSGPRNVSTAMMYAWHHRGDCHAVDEPFYAHYLKATGIDHPGRDEILKQHESDAQRVIDQIVFGNYDEAVLFLKNMPHHMVGLDLGFAERLTNFFLIREPRAMMASFLKKMPSVSMDDLGLERQWQLYEQLVQAGHRPPVVDSEELLKNPSKVLASLCEAMGLEMKEGMLNWPAGPISADGVWASYWYDAVHASSTWAKQQSTTTALPDQYEGLALRCTEIYKRFKTISIKA